MTRLNFKDIALISEELLIDFDKKLKSMAKMSLFGLFRFLSGDKSINDLSNIKIFVIPITAGLGVIPGFTEKVALILKFIGLNSSKTSKTDVEGFYEAFKEGADVIFAADDNIFAAFNLRKKKVIDNSHATGLGYAIILESTLGDLKNKKIILIGAGKVGMSTLGYLVTKGAELIVIEINKEKAEKLKGLSPRLQVRLIEHEDEINTLLNDLLNEKVEGVVVAAPIKQLKIKEEKLDEIKVVHPAVPFSLPIEFINHKNIIYDPLIVGVVSMAALVLK